MAHKNKLFLGTNKDTYIAADEAGNIVFVNENGSEAMLTSEGLIQKAAGENTFAAVGTGTSGTPTPTPTQNGAVTGIVDLAARFPSAKLVAEGQDDVILYPSGTPYHTATFQKATIDFYDYITPTRSLSQVDIFATDMGNNFSEFFFSLPAIAWDPYISWTLEVDFKNILTIVGISTMDPYDPNYINFPYPSSISKVVTKNVVVSSATHLPIQYYDNVFDPYAEIEGVLESDQWIGIHAPFGYAGQTLPQYIKISNLNTWNNMIMTGYLTPYNVDVPRNPDNSPYEISFANLKAYQGIRVDKTDAYDFYDIPFKITEFSTEPIQGGGVAYYNTTYSPTAFPILWGKASPYSSVRYEVQSCQANEDSWEALYQAAKETMKYLSPYDMSIFWVNNNYEIAIDDPYGPIFTDARAEELANLGVYLQIN